MLRPMQESTSDRVRRRLDARVTNRTAFARALGRTDTWPTGYFKGDHDLRLVHLDVAAAFVGLLAEDLVSVTEPTATESDSGGRLNQHPAPTGADVMNDKAPGLEIAMVGFARSVLELRDDNAEKTFRRLILEALETVEKEHETRFPQDAVAQESARK